MRAGLQLAGLVLAVLVAGNASADSLALRSGSPAWVSGAFAATGLGGVVRVAEFTTTGSAVLENATGTITLLTREVINLAAPHANMSAIHDAQPAESVDVPVRNARVAITLDNEAFMLTLLGSDRSRVSAFTSVEGAGLPARLPARIPTAELVSLSPPGPRAGSENLAWAWEAGWTFVGRYHPGGIPKATGAPPMPQATVAAAGAVSLQLKGGVVSFVDANGAQREARLGNWTSGPGVENDAAQARVQTSRSMFFVGTVESFEAPAGGAWGLAAPDLEWTLDGEARWSHASGTAERDGRTVSFTDVPVDLRGEAIVRPRPPAPLDGPAPVHYTGEGEFDTLTVNGARVLGAAERAAVVVASASIAALVAALLLDAPRSLALRSALALYTRISRADLLAHPRRAAIHASVASRPGIHLRELHRVVGGGWGIFRAHFDLLVRGGYLRGEAHGKYVAVFLADAPHAAAVIPNDLARAAFESLPRDGSPVPVAAVRVASGTSRQLLNYHLKTLAHRGLVRFSEDETGARSVSRVSNPPDGP